MAENFEDLLDLAGGAGWWQLRTFLLACFAGFPGAIQDFLHVFLAATPNHWCHVPACEGQSYAEIKNLTVPMMKNDERDEYSKCTSYSYSLGWYPQNESCAVHRWSNRTTPCSEYDYDRETFEETIVTEWDLVCEDEIWASTSQAIYFIGGLIGCFMFGVISDNYGRKTAVMLGASLSIVSGLLAAIAPSFELFLVARFFLALGSSAVFGISDVLVLEVVGAKWRGLAGSMFEIPYGLGYASTAMFAYLFRNWRHLQLAVMVPTLLFLVLIFFVDESPRWLITQGEAAKAEKILRSMAKANGRQHLLPPNFTVMVHEVTVKESGSVIQKKSSREKFQVFTEQFLSLFRTPKMRRRTLALNFCWFTVAMVYNGGSFNGSNLSANLFLYEYVLINGLLDIPACLLVPMLIKTFGRRNVFSGIFFLSAISLCSSLLFQPGSWMVIALSWIGIGFSMGTGYILVYVYGSEMMPTTVRSYGIGVATLLAKGGSVSGLYVAGMLGKVHKMAPAIVLGIMSLAAGFVGLLLPETSKKRMPETVADVENSET